MNSERWKANRNANHDPGVEVGSKVLCRGSTSNNALCEIVQLDLLKWISGEIRADVVWLEMS